MTDLLRHALIACARRGAGTLRHDGLLDLVRFIYSRQDTGGGFVNRAQHPDLYYTAFALQSLFALGQPLPCRDVGDWLAAVRIPANLPLTELCSYIRCRLLTGHGFTPEESAPVVARLQEAFPFEGVSTEALGEASLLDAFTVAAACADLGIPGPSDATLVHLLYLTARAGGAFAATQHANEPTTVATVAGCILTRLCSGATQSDETRHWLLACRHPDGGYIAAHGLREADLLSTGCALYALRTVYQADLADQLGPVQSFLAGLWDESGGFVAQARDPVPDLEYTFHALVALGACVP